MTRGVSALSAIYGRVATFRRAWYEGRPSSRRRLTTPAISVGNLVIGGSGKTPVVAAIARLLLQSGERPAILSRGYARRDRSDGVVVVSDGTAIVADVAASGDEPQMLARALPAIPVVVSADRYLAGRLAETRFGATVMMLDDAFQHVQLERTVDLLVVAREDLDERVLPSGRLREPLTAARAADAVLVYGTADDARHVAAALGVPASFTVTTTYGAVRSIGGTSASPEQRRVAAVAGIARPGRFFGALREQGYEVVRELTYRDHHWFTEADIAAIVAAARDAGVSLVITTEKDAVRLGNIDSAVRWAVLPMDVVIEPAATFASWLTDRIRPGAREVQRR